MLPSDARVYNGLARLLATWPEAKRRDPAQAVKLARKAVELAPEDSRFWNTLGVAHYRAGDGKSALAALEKSVKLNRGGDAIDFFFLALAHASLGRPDEARQWYDKALAWVKKNKETLERNHRAAEETRLFRAEAEEVLRQKKQ